MISLKQYISEQKSYFPNGVVASMKNAKEYVNPQDMTPHQKQEREMWNYLDAFIQTGSARQRQELAKVMPTFVALKSKHSDLKPDSDFVYRGIIIPGRGVSRKEHTRLWEHIFRMRNKAKHEVRIGKTLYYAVMNYMYIPKYEIESWSTTEKKAWIFTKRRAATAQDAKDLTDDIKDYPEDYDTMNKFARHLLSDIALPVLLEARTDSSYPHYIFSTRITNMIAKDSLGYTEDEIVCFAPGKKAFRSVAWIEASLFDALMEMYETWLEVNNNKEIR